MSLQQPYRNLGLQICTWICLGLLLLPIPSATAADEWKTVFNPYEVITLHLQMDTNDWDRVRHDQPSQSESWVPEIAEALMWGAGETPLRVTVRRKG